MNEEIELAKSWFELAKIFITIAGFLGVIAGIFIGFFSSNFLEVLKIQKDYGIVYLNNPPQIMAWLKVFYNGLFFLYMSIFATLISLVCWFWGHNIITKRFNKSKLRRAIILVILLSVILIIIRL